MCGSSSEQINAIRPWRTSSQCTRERRTPCPLSVGMADWPGLTAEAVHGRPNAGKISHMFPFHRFMKRASIQVMPTACIDVTCATLMQAAAWAAPQLDDQLAKQKFWIEIRDAYQTAAAFWDYLLQQAAQGNLPTSFVTVHVQRRSFCARLCAFLRRAALPRYQDTLIALHFVPGSNEKISTWSYRAKNYCDAMQPLSEANWVFMRKTTPYIHNRPERYRILQEHAQNLGL